MIGATLTVYFVGWYILSLMLIHLSVNFRQQGLNYPRFGPILFMGLLWPLFLWIVITEK
ncbi:hypothetical protein [Caulobacter phage Cr30]|uniref:hypothetical protein n=1 Tax=Caulobacter phage Cr30 TaxID=1357714 RepID=UPI0004A9B533|nr:hypothetical protein OZ74_gp130 [Caulobacter phage Cr30]AGS81015.1 hypothetical protein [Caulobacter phage Cr30]